MRPNDVATFAERIGFDAQALRRRTGAVRRLAGALPGMLLLGLSGALAPPGPAAAQTSGICDRTQIVQDEIVNAASGVSRCQDVTAAHLESITSLDFTKVGLTSLQAGDFAGLSNLRTLGLRSNALTSVPATLFAGLSNLQTLNLWHTGLTSVPVTLFAGLSNLQTLNLGGNALTSVPVTLFAGLSNLRTLNLGGNALTSVPATLFAGLSNLRSLDLADNRLTSVPATLFAGLSNLRWLHMHLNPLLTSLPPGLLVGLTALKTNAVFTPAFLDVSLVRVDSDPLSEGTPVKFKVNIAQGSLADTPVYWHAIARDGLVNGKHTDAGGSEIKSGETDSGEFSITGTRNPSDTDNKPPRILVIVDAPRFGQRVEGASSLSYSVPNAVSLDFGTASAADRVAVYVLDAGAEEGNDIEFPVRLSDAVASDVTLNWKTGGGTARPSAPGTSGDYTPQSAGRLTVAAGATEGTITVSTVEDMIHEWHDWFEVELSAPSLPAGVVLVTDTVQGTIYNDDTEIALEDVTVFEGQPIRVPFVYSHPPVAYFYPIMTAAHGTTNTDDVSFTNCVRGVCSTGNAALRTEFSIGASIRLIRSSRHIGTALRDHETEGDEYFTVTLEHPPDGYPSGQSLTFKNGKTTARVTIKDTVPATLSIADAAAAEGDDVSFTLRLSEALAVDAYVYWYTTDGTAASSDYLRRFRRMLTIPAGRTAVPLPVHTREDANPESDETFTVRIERPTDRAFQSPVLLGKSEATGTIHNDDARISLADAAAEEGEAIEFTVTLSHPLTADVTLDWQTGDDAQGDHPALSADDTNTGGKADYTPVSNGSLTIPAGDRSGTFTVQTSEDVDKEQDETFIVTLREPGAGFPAGSSLTLTDAEAIGTIRNDDTPTLSVSDATAEEGQSMTFTVTLGIVWPEAVTVDWSLRDGTATAPADYPSNQSGSVTIPANDASGPRTFTVQTAEDTLAEGAETFKAVLAAPAGGFPSADVTINDAEGVGTITDNDVTTVSIADGRASEGADVEFAVSLSTAASSDLVLKWETADGTGANAALGTGASPDYTPQSNGSLTVPAGATGATIRVPALIDNVVEDPETFTVEVSAPDSGLPSWAELGDTVATGTITDDSTPPTVTFTPAHGTKTGDVNVNVVLAFDEPVRQANGNVLDDTAAKAAVSLKKAGDNTELASAARVTVNAGKTEIEIDPANALAPGSSYTVKLLAGTVEDEQGNELGPERSATFEVDTAAPTVTFTPAHGTKTGDVNVNVVLAFDEPVRQANGNVLDDTAAKAAVSLKKAGDNTELASAARVTVNAGKTEIEIDPANALAPGSSYTVKLLAGTVEDEQGNELGPERSATFEVDTAAPTVTFTPAHGTKTGDVNVNVVLAFDEPVRQANGNVLDDTAAKAAVSLKKAGDNTELASAARVTVNAGKTEIEIDPANALAPGSSYTVKLLAGTVEDEQGNELGPERSATFEVDTAAPTVTFTPAHGTKTGDVNVNVVLAFDEPVRQANGNVLDDTAAKAAVSLKKAGDNTELASAARVTVNAGKTEIEIDPANALAPGSSYTVKLLAGTVEDEQGNELGPERSATFEVDTAAPTVTFAPADGATAGPGTTVTATFTEAVRNRGGADLTDANAHAAVELKKADGTGPDLAIQSAVTVNDDKTKITIDPANPLAAGSYTVKVLGNAVEDKAGNALASAQTATFTVDAAAPTVTFAPADGATAGPGADVTATFSEAIRLRNGNAVTDANAHTAVELKKGNAGADLAVSGRVTIDADNKIVTIVPASALAAGSYTVKVLGNAVQDAYGNAVAAASATFTVDAAAPTVTFSPLHGATAGPGATVKATFTEAIRNVGDGSAVTDANAHAVVELKKDGTGPDLAAANRVTIDADNKIVTIAPASDLAAGSYTVRVLGNTVQDAYGNAVATARAVFTVDAAAPTVTFSPANGDTVADAGVNVTVTFGEAVRKAAGGGAFDAEAAAAAVELKAAGGTADLADAAAVSFSGRVITIAPASDLADGVYTVKLLKDLVEDLHGNGIDSDRSATFTVDATAPTVTFAPADGDTAGPGTTVTATFTEAVRNRGGADLTNANAHAAVELKKDGTGPDLAIQSAVTVNDDKTKITIVPASPLVAGSYTVRAPGNAVEDKAGNALASAQTATFTVDAAAPTVTFVPKNGATAGPGADVTVTFSEAIRLRNGNAVTDANAHTAVELKKGNAGADLAVSGRVTIDADNKIVTIVPASALAAGSYTVKVLGNAVQDAYGNAVAAASATFTVDAAAPTVTFSPLHGATAGPGATVKATFTEAIRNVGDGSAVTDANAHAVVELKKDGTGPDLAAANRVTIDADNKIVTIVPASALAAGSYTVKVLGNAVQDAYGNAVAADSATFTVDATAPTVTFSPLHGATAGPGADVTATFTEAIRLQNDAPVTDANAHTAVELKKDGAGADLAAAGRVTVNGNKTVLTIDPASPLAAGSYTVRVLANTVEDIHGNAVAAASATFTVDAAAPTVTFSPLHGATAGPGVTVKATFTEAIRLRNGNAVTDTNAHTVVELKKADGTGADLAVTGRVTVDAANKIIAVDPDGGLAAGSYTVKVLANAVEDIHGNAVAAASATFTVDAAAPTVTFAPADGATAGPGVTVKATFTEAIRNVGDGSAVTNANAHAAVELKKDDSGPDLAVSGRVTVDAAKKIVTIAPASPLAAGSYTVKVLANAVEDIHGNAVAAASTTFTVDAAAPTVTFAPADGATAGPGADVTATFSEAIRLRNGNAVTDANAHTAVELKKGNAGADLAVSGRVTIDADNKIVTIVPASALAAGSYTVKVLGNAVQDAYGNAVAAASATFTVDAAAPTVTFSPLHGATAGPGATVKATFTEAIRNVGDGSAVTDANAHAVVELKKDGTGPDLAAANRVTIDADNKIVTIAPASDLAAGSYTVRVLGNTVQDAYGNAVATARAVFTVDAAAPTVTFSPANGDTVADAGVNVTVTFGEAVRKAAGGGAFDAEAAAAAVELKAAGGTADLADAAAVSFSGRVITIAPASDLADGVYTVKLLKDLVEDLHGNGIDSDRSATFTVDATAPTVTFSPLDGATAGPGTTVTATFSEAIRNVDGTDLTDANAHAAVELKKDDTGADLAVGGRVTVNSNKTVLAIVPASPLAAGSYTVRVLGNRVEDNAGNALARAQTATFTVDAAGADGDLQPGAWRHGGAGHDRDGDVQRGDPPPERRPGHERQRASGGGVEEGRRGR